MASVKKFTDHAVANQIRHCKREILNNKNPDILPKLKGLNDSLSPNRGMTEMEYYKKRKSELYCYKREDVKTLAGWIVTAPKELESLDEEKAFFEGTYRFLENRYGRENVICAVVHRDEGVVEQVQNRWGEYVKDEDGKIREERIFGRSHLHFLFIPVVEDRKQKHKDAGYTHKICANEVLTPEELRSFHGDLQDYLKENGIKGKVLTGITKAQGRNYTVRELKDGCRQRDFEAAIKEERKVDRQQSRW